MPSRRFCSEPNWKLLACEQEKAHRPRYSVHDRLTVRYRDEALPAQVKAQGTKDCPHFTDWCTQVTGFGEGFNRGLLIEYDATPEYPLGSHDNKEQLPWSTQSLSRILRHSAPIQYPLPASSHCESHQPAPPSTSEDGGAVPCVVSVEKLRLPSGVGRSRCSKRNREPVVWACCDLCSKWRRVCIAPTSDAAWTCSDNLDRTYNKCSEPQELSDQEIDREIEASNHSRLSSNAVYDSGSIQQQIRKSPHYLSFFRYIHHRQLLWATHTNGVAPPAGLAKHGLEFSDESKSKIGLAGKFRRMPRLEEIEALQMTTICHGPHSARMRAAINTKHA